MFDSCRRDIHYLRLSVTDRCNLRCRYCMPDCAKILEHEEVLTHEEFLRRWCARVWHSWWPG